MGNTESVIFPSKPTHRASTNVERSQTRQIEQKTSVPQQPGILVDPSPKQPSLSEDSAVDLTVEGNNVRLFLTGLGTQYPSNTINANCKGCRRVRQGSI